MRGRRLGAPVFPIPENEIEFAKTSIKSNYQNLHDWERSRVQSMLFIGIDLGTSACKLLLVGEDGTIQNEVTKEYPLSFPHPGWAEQRPEDWWDAVVTGVPELLRGFDANDVAGIGSGGQMHGLVALDEHDHVIRPAILWNDGRTFKEVDYLNNVVGKDRLSELTANIAFAGFTAPKLLWMRENEPENFEKSRRSCSRRTI